MTAIPVRRSRRVAEIHALPVNTSTAGALALVFAAVLLGPCAFVVERLNALWPVLTCVPWLAAAVVAPRFVRGSPRAGFVFTVSALATAATWAGVLLGMQRQDAFWHHNGHPAFGEHPVLWRTGLPWRGIEGSDHGHGMDKVPFDMGVDALLVNYAVFALVAAVLLVRRTPGQRATWAMLGACGAAFGAMVGGWQLVVMFD